MSNPIILSSIQKDGLIINLNKCTNWGKNTVVLEYIEKVNNINQAVWVREIDSDVAELILKMVETDG